MLTRFATYFLLLTMLVPATSLGSLLFQCRLDGQIRQACCCQHMEKEQAGFKVSAVATGCCDLSLESDEQSSDLLPHSTTQLDASFLTTPSIAVLSFPEHPRKIFPLGAQLYPPRRGPPVFLRVCSFLI